LLWAFFGFYWISWIWWRWSMKMDFHGCDCCWDEIHASRGSSCYFILAYALWTYVWNFNFMHKCVWLVACNNLYAPLCREWC
jgi:hypothetical protein